ncbi:NrfD/PsrC family molybdoenzyme membrane anchor subunit [Pyrodictium delaneyi]|uniref:Polysulfide reductase n=1 Tax=Pyrodictium delaneyi TaxID=1273541 RepID=A0A211YQU8_9CREN|nr:NrfD/PsrC family molybdoenzyme membrane anchor subunit [Pyrodictium delaneyi]OWJ55425.1 hypothetical protein Pdsh_01055 [Pyrodictium delaneyi]
MAGEKAKTKDMGVTGYALLGVGALLTLLFIYGVYGYQTLSEASPLHALVPWGLMVTGYVFFAISSGGVFDALAIRLGIYCEEEALPLARKTLWLALALLVPGILLVFADLTHIGHSMWIYLGFNPSARIAWNGILYIVYAGFAVTTLLYTIMKGEEALTKPIGRALLLGGLLASLTLEYNLALAFGQNLAVPAWFSVPLGVLNIALAFMLGAAWTAIGLGEVATRLTALPLERWRECCVRGVSKELAGMAVAVGFLVMWSLVQQEGWGLATVAKNLLVGGELAGVFWLGVLLAVIAPIVLGLYAGTRVSRPAMVAGSIAGIVGAFLLLHSLVVAGQLARLEAMPSYEALAAHALGQEYKAEVLHELLASPIEAAAVVGGFGLWLLLYIIGLRILAIEPGEKPNKILVLR